MPLAPSVRSRFGMLAAIAVAAIGVMGYLRSARGVDSMATGDPLLLTDVANETPDTGLARAVRTAATVALQQSGRLRLYPRSRLPTVYRLMGIHNADTTLGYALGREVAERDHVRFVLALAVETARGGYRLTGRLADVQRRRDAAEFEATAESKDQLVNAVDDVVRSVRRTLGESRSEVAASWAPLPRVTTSSLEALRSFAEGSDAWLEGQYPRAKELLLRAVDLDTGFAMALGALGAAEYYFHNRVDGERYFAAALARPERLTEWERLSLLRRHATFRGNTDSSLVLSALITARFPGAMTWYEHGTALMNAGRPEDAITALDKALAFDPRYVNAWVNRATSYANLGRHEQAVASYARAGALDSTALYRNNFNNEYGQQLVFLGRLADAETLYSRMAGGQRLQDRALGLRSLGFLYHWQGRLDESIDAFSRATAATRQMRAALSEGRNHLLLATVYRAANRRADAEAAITRALALDTARSFEPTMLAILAYACEQSQRTRDVESVAALLRSRVDTQNRRDRGAAAFTEAVRHMSRHRPDSALANLRQATDFSFGAPRLMLMARAFIALQQRDSAKATLLTIIRQPFFGSEGQADRMHAPLLLGELLLQTGDTTGAVEQYRDVVARWRNSTIDTPDVVAAKSRLATLNGAQWRKPPTTPDSR